MPQDLARSARVSGTVGTFRYLDAGTRSSLFRNGEVLTRRDAAGSDHGYTGVNLAEHELFVADGRALGGEERPTLAANGFELAASPLEGDGPDFLDHEAVVRSYYPHCAAVEIHYPNRIGENYFARHSPRHRWIDYPAATCDEALRIKQWDSAGSLARSNGDRGDGSDDAAPCTFSFHSAFADPATPPDAPDRWSIEVRCMVLYVG